MQPLSRDWKFVGAHIVSLLISADQERQCRSVAPTELTACDSPCLNELLSRRLRKTHEKMSVQGDRKNTEHVNAGRSK